MTKIEESGGEASGEAAPPERPLPRGTVAVKESFFAKFGAPFYALPPLPPIERKIYRFDQEDTDENIAFTKDEEGTLQVRGGTVEKLVERMSYPTGVDPAEVKAFLLTYRSFVTPAELFDCLVQRYNSEPPSNLRGGELEEWKKNVQTPVRLRVFNLLKTWISTYYYDFAEDAKLVQDLNEFINKDMMSTGMEKAATSLQNILQRSTTGKDTERDIIFTKPPPKPFIPTNLTGALSLNDLNPEEIARQLTLIEYDLFKAIKPWECLGQAWTKKEKEKKAPNILAMISRFNYVSRWVATEVVKGETVKDRSNNLRVMLEIADKCKALNNFNGTMEVISGLQATSVYRLKQTWAAIPPKSQKIFEEMTALMSSESNFKFFRQHLHAIDPPCIPYLGVYLTDLTFIEDGNQDFLAGGLINFVKRKKLSTVIREIQQYQQAPYCLEAVAFIQDFLLQAEAWEVEDCYKTSLLREQRAEPTQTAAARTQLQKTNSRYRMGGVLPGSPKDRREVQKDEDSTRPTGGDSGDSSDELGEMEVIEGYRFNEKDTEDNIIFSKDNASEIKAGTLAKLIERLTHDKHPDTNFLLNFLMTFPAFTTPEEVLDLLIMRFNPPKPLNNSKEVQEKFKKKIIPIHFRVFNVLKNWLEKFYDQDFKDRPELVEKLQKFLDNDLKASMEKATDQLTKTLQKKAEGGTELEWRLILGTAPAPAPSALLKIPPEQIAAAFLQFHSDLYISIRPREVLKRVWLSTDRAAHAPCLTALKEQTLKVNWWILSEIVRETNTKRRANVLAYFIQVAERCLEMANIEAATSFIDGIGSLPVQLCFLWDWVSNAAQKAFKKVSTIVRNSTCVTAYLADKPKPWIHPIDDILKDVVETEESNPEFVEGSSGAQLINFEKRRLSTEKFLSVQLNARPSGSLKFTAPPEVFEFLKKVSLLPQEEIRKKVREIGDEEEDVFAIRVEFGKGEFNDLEAREAEMGLSSRSACLSRILFQDTIPTPNPATMFTELKPLIEKETGKPSGGVPPESLDKVVTALREEALDFSKNFLDEITVSRYFAGLTTRENYQSAAKNITARVFSFLASSAPRRGGGAIFQVTSPANVVVTEWAYNDETGEVFGWPEQLKYLVVEKEGRKTLVEVQAFTDKAQVSSMMRSFNLFSRTLPPGGEAQAAIITSDVTQEGRSYAAKNDIEIFLCR